AREAASSCIPRAAIARIVSEVAVWRQHEVGATPSMAVSATPVRDKMEDDNVDGTGNGGGHDAGFASDDAKAHHAAQGHQEAAAAAGAVAGGFRALAEQGLCDRAQCRACRECRAAEGAALGIRGEGPE